MANRIEARLPVAHWRWRARPGLDHTLWLGVWLGLLALLFSGTGMTLGTLRLSTIHVDGAFIAQWWAFISPGVVVTLELSLASIAGATLLARRCAAWRRCMYR